MQTLGHSKLASDNYDTAGHVRNAVGLLLFAGQFVGVTWIEDVPAISDDCSACALYFLRLWHSSTMQRCKSAQISSGVHPTTLRGPVNLTDYNRDFVQWFAARP
jgi:hypothetical protein